MNQFHKNYQTVTKLVPGKLAEGFRTMFSGGYNVPTDDVRAVKDSEVSYLLQYLPISSSGKPDLTGHTLDRVASSLLELEERVAVLAMSPNLTEEIRAVKQQCDNKDVYVVLVKRKR